MADSGIAAVFLANRVMVRRLLAARTGDPAEADDIIQEMWVRLETARVGPVGEPLAYLMRMALNLAADRQLAARRRLARDDAWVALQPGGADYPNAERSMASAEECARRRRWASPACSRPWPPAPMTAARCRWPRIA